LVKASICQRAQASASAPAKARRTLSSLHTLLIPNPTGLTVSARKPVMCA